jgi:hypothetical protein
MLGVIALIVIASRLAMLGVIALIVSLFPGFPFLLCALNMLDPLAPGLVDPLA